MGSRWEFRGPRGFEQFDEATNEQIHRAWASGRPDVRYAVRRESYRLDFRKMEQMNRLNRTTREVRPPAAAVAEMLVTAKRPASFYARTALSMLQSSEGKDPVVQLHISALGNAMPAAVSAASHAEKAGKGIICSVQTTTEKLKDDDVPVSCIKIKVRSVEAAQHAKLKKWKDFTSTMDKADEQMPRLNLLRLMKEFKSIERALAARCAECGLVSCEPIEDSLLDWEVNMVFPDDSELQEGLKELADKAVEASESHLTLHVRFPLDYPMSPPGVWVHRPRLVNKEGPVTFGGRLCTMLLSSAGWQPASSMLDIFNEIHTILARDAKVDITIPVRRSYLPTQPLMLERLKTENIPMANGFIQHGLTVLSAHEAHPMLGDAGMLHLNTTDKIGLPYDYAVSILDPGEGRECDLPMMFEIKTCLGRKRHCVLYDFIVDLPKTHVILPQWVMQDLGLEERDKVTVRGVKLDLIDFVKIQPHSVDFYRAVKQSGMEAGPLLTQTLARFSALTEDTAVPIEINGEPHNVQIMELRPPGACRIIDQDMVHYFEFAVDFEPAPDLEDEAALQARNDRYAEKLKATTAQIAEDKKAYQDRRLAAIQQHFEAEKQKYLALAGEEAPPGNALEVALRLPDRTQVRAKFAEGAPFAAIMSCALCSKWAESCKPWGLLLRTSLPPVRILSESDSISKDMHRAVLNVQEVQVPEDDELFAARRVVQPEPSPSPEPVPEPEPVPPPPPLLQREFSLIQRRTLQAFEVQRFVRAGVAEEEALRRYADGEILPPGAASMKPRPPPVLSRPMFSEPSASSLPSWAQQPPEQPTHSEDPEKQQQIEEVANITGAERATVIQMLQATDWDPAAAIGLIFDAA